MVAASSHQDLALRLAGDLRAEVLPAAAMIAKT
jgi:hypothetical protein